MIHLQQTREEDFQNTFRLQEKIKNIYDRKTKEKKFQLEDVVLWWDAQNKEKGKHGKFDNLWKVTYKISAYRGHNAFLLKEMDGQECLGGPVNGRLLKHYYFWCCSLNLLHRHCKYWFTFPCKISSTLSSEPRLEVKAINLKWFV